MNTLTKPCLNCGKIIIKGPNRSLKDWINRTKFCSISCKAKYIVKTPLWIKRQSESHKGKKLSLKTRKKMSEAQSGEKGSNWRGDRVGYIGIHNWLRKNFGYANRCEMEGCVYPRKGAKKWMEKPCRYEWALLKGKMMERKRENFIQLCMSCHRKYDSVSN